MLYGDPGPSHSIHSRFKLFVNLDVSLTVEPAPETVAQLAQEVYATDLLYALVTSMWRFEFEVRHGATFLCVIRLVTEGEWQARKDVAQIFTHLLRRQIGSRWPTVEYLNTKDEIVFAVLKGCFKSVRMSVGVLWLTRAVRQVREP